MTDAALSIRAAELRRLRVPFVHARVVFAAKPTSAKPGDEAIVLADGTIEGFVGGDCAESTVRAQALALLDSGESLLVRICPLPEEASPGKLVVHNPCLSGGTMEIFLQPTQPPPYVVVVGDAPVARALFALGAPLGYEIAAYSDPLPGDTAALVVASHGREETDALAAALRARGALRRARRQSQAWRGGGRWSRPLRVDESPGAHPGGLGHRRQHGGGDRPVDSGRHRCLTAEAFRSNARRWRRCSLVISHGDRSGVPDDSGGDRVVVASRSRRRALLVLRKRLLARLRRWPQRLSCRR